MFVNVVETWGTDEESIEEVVTPLPLVDEDDVVIELFETKGTEVLGEVVTLSVGVDEEVDGVGIGVEVSSE